MRDVDGNGIGGVNVDILVVGVSRSVLTNDKCHVSFKVSSLVPSSYVADISFSGNDDYAASRTTANVVVKDKIASQLSANNIFINYGWLFNCYFN